MTESMAWALLGLIVLVGGAIILWQRRRAVAAVRRGDWARTNLGEICAILWTDYLDGVVDPRLLEQATSLPKPSGASAWSHNYLVCLDVAAGRYREALAWRSRWGADHNGHPNDLVVKINEAEALACLGQWQASLDHVAVESPNVFTTAGLSAHRAWVLAELGRLDEARVELARGKPHLDVLGAFRAEWHFSRFAIEFAARDWSQANLALLEAEMYAARETTRRNLHFLRGRLACARGDDQEALKHFGRGSQSVYRWQGGAALLDWGDALSRLGRREDALVVWNECLIRDPQSPAAGSARARIASVSPQ